MRPWAPDYTRPVARGGRLSAGTPLKDVVSSNDYTEMSVKSGHIGLSVGSRAHKEIWPKATAWMGERSTPVEND